MNVPHGRYFSALEGRIRQLSARISWLMSALEGFTGGAILENTPQVLRTLLSVATPEQLDWRPNAERWSIAMVLAHLADVEENGFRARFRAMAQQESPFLASYNQMKFFETPRAFDGPGELENFAAARLATLADLRALPDDALARTGRHEELGTITIAELLHEFAFHDLGHIRQIAELYRAHAFYPLMGGFQKYYQVHP
jgi:DinB superfamily